jgi:hypothetical protein
VRYLILACSCCNIDVQCVLKMLQHCYVHLPQRCYEHLPKHHTATALKQELMQAAKGFAQAILLG